MGFYLNSTDPLELYKGTNKSPYFVDKSGLLVELNELIGSEMKYICVTRPRRFGKSIAATMAGSYYSKGCDASDVFAEAKISECKSYRDHLNCHNVIYIDFSSSDDSYNSYDEYIEAIKEILRDDLHNAYPDVEYRKNGSVMEDLRRIRQVTGAKFIFVFDEWDAVFHMRFVTKEDRDKYLLFLKYLLKGKSYVELAYMTGILPIAKYSSGSELNMFAEYTMASQEKFGDYFGFTETEVDELYQKYLKKVKIPKVTREEIRAWYDGYFSFSGERLYNPRSVVLALMNNQLSDYWTSSGPYDEIFYYIKHNIADVRDDIAAMLVYGFLTCRNNELSIPNKELMDKFVETVRTEKITSKEHECKVEVLRGAGVK